MLYIDFETRSEENLKTAGAWKYSKHPSTEIICLGLLDDKDPKKRIYCYPQTVLNDLIWTDKNGNLHFDKIKAHYAFFEFAIWHNVGIPKHGWPPVPADHWFCSMAQASMHGLPEKLESIAIILGLSETKDMVGNRLMIKLSKPRSTWVKNKKGPKYFDDPNELIKLYEYCKQDVKVEYQISQKLNELPGNERKVWLLDQKINRRGIPCDLELSKKAIEILKVQEEEAKKEIADLTENKISSPTQTVALQKYINTKSNINIPDMRAETIRDFLTDEYQSIYKYNPEVKKLLELRRDNSQNSTKKYKSALQSSYNSRIHGTLAYHRALTGRWAGKRFQPQNLVKPKYDINILEKKAIPAIMKFDIDTLKSIGPINKVLGSCSRSIICAPKGHLLICADFSTIETSVLFWEVGDLETLEKIEKGRDLYIDMASLIFKQDYEDLKYRVGIEDREALAMRSVGKTAILSLGYGVGADRFYRTCISYDLNIVTRILAKNIIDIYRSKYKKVCRFWTKLSNLFVNTIKHKYIKDGSFEGIYDGTWLKLRLRSGRYIYYFQPKINYTAGGQLELSYKGEDSYTHKWTRLHIYGGKLVGHRIQATARDLIASALLQLDKKGYDILFSSHDEAIAEIEENSKKHNLQDFIETMCKPPDWALGCSIKAKGWIGKRYRK